MFLTEQSPTNHTINTRKEEQKIEIFNRDFKRLYEILYFITVSFFVILEVPVERVRK